MGHRVKCSDMQECAVVCNNYTLCGNSVQEYAVVLLGHSYHATQWCALERVRKHQMPLKASMTTTQPGYNFDVVMIYRNLLYTSSSYIMSCTCTGTVM